MINRTKRLIHLFNSKLLIYFADSCAKFSLSMREREISLFPTLQGEGQGGQRNIIRT